MQGQEQKTTTVTYEWVMKAPVTLAELQYAQTWARQKADELHGEGAGRHDDAAKLVIIDEDTVAMRVYGGEHHG